MTNSFTTTQGHVLAGMEPTRRNVLITGAAGRIGSYFAEQTQQKYNLRLMVQDIQEAEQIQSFGEVVAADLVDLARMKEVCRDIDTVVHLAGDPSPSATWQRPLVAAGSSMPRRFMPFRATQPMCR